MSNDNREHSGLFIRARGGSEGERELSMEEAALYERHLGVKQAAEAMLVFDSHAFVDVQMAWMKLFPLSPFITTEDTAQQLAGLDTGLLGQKLQFAARYFTPTEIRRAAGILSEWARLLEEQQSTFIDTKHATDSTGDSPPAKEPAQ